MIDREQHMNTFLYTHEIDFCLSCLCVRCFDVVSWLCDFYFQRIDVEQQHLSTTITISTALKLSTQHFRTWIFSILRNQNIWWFDLDLNSVGMKWTFWSRVHISEYLTDYACVKWLDSFNSTHFWIVLILELNKQTAIISMNSVFWNNKIE